MPGRAPQVGRKNRSVGATQMNQDSSRSHSIFSITIEVTEKFDAAAAAQAASSGAVGCIALCRQHMRSAT